MNYYDKYMKYKIKYINLVNSIGGSADALEGAKLFYNSKRSLYHPTNEPNQSYPLEKMKESLQQELSQYQEANNKYNADIIELENKNEKLNSEIDQAQRDFNQSTIENKKKYRENNQTKIQELENIMTYLNKINQEIFQAIPSKILELEDYKKNPSSYRFI